MFTLGAQLLNILRTKLQKKKITFLVTVIFTKQKQTVLPSFYKSNKKLLNVFILKLFLPRGK